MCRAPPGAGRVRRRRCSPDAGMDVRTPRNLLMSAERNVLSFLALEREMERDGGGGEREREKERERGREREG